MHENCDNAMRETLIKDLMKEWTTVDSSPPPTITAKPVRSASVGANNTSFQPTLFHPTPAASPSVSETKCSSVPTLEEFTEWASSSSKSVMALPTTIMTATTTEVQTKFLQDIKSQNNYNHSSIIQAEHMHSRTQQPHIRRNTVATSSVSPAYQFDGQSINMGSQATSNYFNPSQKQQQQQQRRQQQQQQQTLTQAALISPQSIGTTPITNSPMHSIPSNTTNILHAIPVPTTVSHQIPTMGSTQTNIVTSTTSTSSSANSYLFTGGQKRPLSQDQMDRKERKLEKNRLAARECRKKKKEYLMDVEQRVQDLERENAELRKELERYKSRFGECPIDNNDVNEDVNDEVQIKVEDKLKTVDDTLNDNRTDEFLNDV